MPQAWLKSNEILVKDGNKAINKLVESAGVVLSKLSIIDGDIKLRSDFTPRFDVILTDSVNTNSPPGHLNQAEYEEELDRFKRPHFHYTDEIRFIKAGGCYFDIQSVTGEWVRLRLQSGDAIFLPAGLFHCVFLDEKQHVKVSGYFRSRGLGDEYVPIYACEDNHPVKALYYSSIKNPAEFSSLV